MRRKPGMPGVWLQILRPAVLLATIASALGMALWAEDAGRVFADGRQTFAAEMYIGPEGKVDDNSRCIDCHSMEYKAWQRTHHHDSQNAGDSDLAFELTFELDLGEMREVELCSRCHFTRVPVSGQTHFYGVSCESCHGPARDWGPVHHEVWEELEGVGSREEHLQNLVSSHMIRPQRLYDLAQNCFQCHIMAREEQELSVETLVNTKTAEGQHPASSPGFELLSWSQGEIRHNFRKPDNSEDPANPESDRQRSLYVVGKLLDLEYSLRALAGATDAEGRFFGSLRHRVLGDEGALASLVAIRAALGAEHPVSVCIASIEAAVPAELIAVDQGEALAAAADAIRAEIKPLFNGDLEAWPLDELETSLAAVEELLPADTQGASWRP